VIAPGFDFGFSEGVGVIVLDGPLTQVAVVNARVGDQLLQFPALLDSVDDNIVSGNTIAMLPADGSFFSGGLYIAVKSNGTVVRNNAVTGGVVGIHLPGYGDASRLAVPGRCAGDATRFCRAERFGDCAISGIDTASLGPCRQVDALGEVTGSCAGATCVSDDECADGASCESFIAQPGILRVRSTTVAMNDVSGALECGIDAFNVKDAVIADNTVHDNVATVSGSDRTRSRARPSAATSSATTASASASKAPREKHSCRRSAATTSSTTAKRWSAPASMARSAATTGATTAAPRSAPPTPSAPSPTVPLIRPA